MTTLEQIQADIDEIKARNKRVEADKAWETSWTRKVVIAVVTYFVVVVFFIFAHLPNPFVNAIVPAIAFVISSFSVPFLRKFWITKVYKK